MGRSCGHCCTCCGCSETIEEFSLRAGQTFSLIKYFVYPIIDGKREPKYRCKVVKPSNGYGVSEDCQEQEISDEDYSNCSTSCSSATKKWYLMETDSCEVKLSGNISCDGALVGLPEKFTYIPEANDDNAPEACNMFANFEIVTCCSDPVKKKNIENSALCLTSIKKPLCESCSGSDGTVIAGSTLPLPNTGSWKLCQYFNVVGVAPKLYTTFSHNYDGNCDLPCGPTPPNTSAWGPYDPLNTLYTVGNPGQPYLRGFSRKWVIQRSQPRTVNDVGDLCCPPIISGEIDEHGRLLPSGFSDNSTLTPKPKTCNYCLDGSWHCNPEMILSFSGSINGPLKTEEFLNLLKNNETEEPVVASEPTLRLTVDEDQTRRNGSIQPKFCCDFLHDPIVLNWRTDPSIFGWVPNSEIQEDGSRKTRFVLERVPRERLRNMTYLSDIEISYNIQYFGEDDLLNPTGAFFRLEIVVDTGFTVETIVLDSHRICPTTDGKIDCNFLNQNILYFNKIHRQSISIGKFLSSFGGSYDDILNGDEIVPTLTASNCYMMSDSTNAGAGYCVKAAHYTNCNYSLDSQTYTYPQGTTVINPETANTYEYALKVCCCDNEYVVKYNTDILEEYPDIDYAGASQNDTNEVIGKRCNCFSFAPGLMCAGSGGKRLAVIIIDESSPVYTRDGCVCSSNTNFLADLAEFRAKAPNTKIVLIQPAIGGQGPCLNNSLYFYKSWLTGGCPIPEEVIGTVGGFPRDSNPRENEDSDIYQRQAVYDLLIFLYRHYSGAAVGFGDSWYGGDPNIDPYGIYGRFTDQRSLDERDPIDNVYTGMDIYRDTSGSVTDDEFRIGVKRFIDGGIGLFGYAYPAASEVFPTATFTDQTFNNEAWLKYAVQSKGSKKCLGIEDDGYCNRKVSMYRGG